MANYSRSMIETFARCPRQYKRRYVDRVADNITGSPAQVGLALHAAVEDYTRYLLSTKERSNKDKFRDICQGHFFKLTPEEFLDASHVAAEFVESYVMLLDYVKGIEVQLEAPLNNGDIAIGIIDRLDVVMDERIIVHDYKTSRHVLPPFEVARDFQMLFYGWLASVNYPEVQEVHAAQLFIRYGVTKNALLSWEDINTTGKYINRLVERMKVEDKFMPVPSSRCAYCPHLSECVTEHYLRQPQTDEEILRQYQWAQATVTAIEPRLRELAKDKPVEYDSETLLGFWERITQSYGTQAVIVACTALGLDPADYLQAKTSAVNKLAKRKDEWGRTLRQARQYKTGTYFGKMTKQKIEHKEVAAEDLDASPD